MSIFFPGQPVLHIFKHKGLIGRDRNTAKKPPDYTKRELKFFIKFLV